MYTIEFYETSRGKSQVFDFLENLRIRMSKSKDARIQYSQAVTYIQLLSDNGTRGLPDTIAECLGDGIWELRPGSNRILFFFCDADGSYVLLHQFRKKTQKTPKREINRAKAERSDYLLQRNKGKEGE
ncbi:MAG: type II toxin-antitoxin system RelE/ParE family toxin [Lachnospiraceae bacterium]|nr:type II toxin-antitoxin system RelE/ParE family toxin [Lachnospiraceae bacterium]